MTNISRSIEKVTNEFLREKIVLISGPRQVGKTHFSTNLKRNYDYLNFDNVEHRRLVIKKEWKRDKELLVLDEVHKMKSWKQWLKGIYDVEGIKLPIIVTGSARLDVYRKGGDSLAGRHHLLRLMPLSINEVDRKQSKEVFEQLLAFGGFPEPFIKSNARSAKLWRKSHLDVVLREDLLDLEKVRDIKSIEILVDLLAERVGSSISFASLARDLQVSPHTVKHWINVLEDLYVIFVVPPYSKNLSKAHLKEPKIYFYDIGRVEKDAARLENMVAYHLLKRVLFLEDTEGEKARLYYIRDREQREVDFLTVINNKPEWLIEVKTSEEDLSKSLVYYHARVKPEKSFQLLQNVSRERDTASGISIASLVDFLANLET